MMASKQVGGFLNQVEGFDAHRRERTKQYEVHNTMQRTSPLLGLEQTSRVLFDRRNTPVFDRKVAIYLCAKDQVHGGT